jgi:hypothetical protein
MSAARELRPRAPQQSSFGHPVAEQTEGKELATRLSEMASDEEPAADDGAERASKARLRAARKKCVQSTHAPGAL